MKTEKAYLALGCFWEPDEYFSRLPGVIKTQVGYSGGSSDNPTYENLGEHSETIELEFDPAKITYQ
jgi:peptide-methionine (S)-S-oxide reductase